MMETQYINSETVRLVCRSHIANQTYWGGVIIRDWSIPAAVSTLEPYDNYLMCSGHRILPDNDYRLKSLLA